MSDQFIPLSYTFSLDDVAYPSNSVDVLAALICLLPWPEGSSELSVELSSIEAKHCFRRIDRGKMYYFMLALVAPHQLRFMSLLDDVERLSFTCEELILLMSTSGMESSQLYKYLLVYWEQTHVTYCLGGISDFWGRKINKRLEQYLNSFPVMHSNYAPNERVIHECYDDFYYYNIALASLSNYLRAFPYYLKCKAEPETVRPSADAIYLPSHRLRFGYALVFSGEYIWCGSGDGSSAPIGTIPVRLGVPLRSVFRLISVGGVLLAIVERDALGVFVKVAEK
jgi:hypothetical protein